MTDTEQREAARQFANRWNGKGKEDEDGRSFWIDLLSNVLGMENVTEKEKTISTLAEKLSIAEEKEKGMMIFPGQRKKLRKTLECWSERFLNRKKIMPLKKGTANGNGTETKCSSQRC